MNIIYYYQYDLNINDKENWSWYVGDDDFSYSHSFLYVFILNDMIYSCSSYNISDSRWEKIYKKEYDKKLKIFNDCKLLK